MKHYLTILRHCGCLMLAIMVLASSAFAATPSVSNVSSSNQQDQLALTEEQEELDEINADEQTSDENETDFGTDEDNSPSEKVEITPEVLAKVSRYCSFFDIDMSEDEEFVSAVLEDMNDRGWRDVPGSPEAGMNISVSSVGKIQRFIPQSKLADIIWTNNPIQPFNHVGIYTTTTKITEALSKGVQTRKVNQKMDEYPFKIYKVVKSNSTSRYDVDTRRSVATWAKAQVGKNMIRISSTTRRIQTQTMQK